MKTRLMIVGSALMASLFCMPAMAQTGPGMGAGQGMGPGMGPGTGQGMGRGWGGVGHAIARSHQTRKPAGRISRPVTRRAPPAVTSLARSTRHA